jgi:hypothetical protein
MASYDVDESQHTGYDGTSGHPEDVEQDQHEQLLQALLTLQSTHGLEDEHIQDILHRLGQD